MLHRILQKLISLILPLPQIAGGERFAGASIAKVSVLASGKILLNGQAATLMEAKRALEQTSSKRGTVWFYRESARNEAPMEAVELFKFMVTRRLPISLSSRADFSDYLDENGRSHPRNS